MQTFFEMGGYAAFVWPAYGVAAVVLIGLLAASQNPQVTLGQIPIRV